MKRYSLMKERNHLNSDGLDVQKIIDMAIKTANTFKDSIVNSEKLAIIACSIESKINLAFGFDCFVRLSIVNSKIHIDDILISGIRDQSIFI